MKSSRLLAFALFFSLVITGGCASLGLGSGQISTEVRTEPEGLEVLFRGSSVGAAPVSFVLRNLEEALEVTAEVDEGQLMERRIEVLSPDLVRIWLRSGTEPTPLAKALGLGQVTIFDYADNATFDFDSSSLRQPLQPMLRRQAMILNGPFAGIDVYICGHTDNVGNDDYNAVLSVERAEAVARFLTDHEVDESRIHVQGFGEDYPIDDNQSSEGRSRNRRTEILLPD